MTTQVNSLPLELERRIHAPAEVVFRAFLDPDAIKAWWGPEGWRVTELEMSPTPGGRYIYTMSDIAETRSVVLSGHYKVIEPFERLVFTFRWEPSADEPDETPFPETTVTVILRERNGATELRMLHEGLPSPESVEQHRDGWDGTLDCLGDYLA